VNPVVAESLLRGAGTTGVIVAAASTLAAATSLVVALARMSNKVLLRVGAAIFTEFFRGTSALVQLFWAYFVLPALGLQLPAIGVGIAVLGLNAGAYGSEVVRASITAVPAGQWEASKILGLSPATRMGRVILPQALRIALPPLESLLVDILKASALVSLITIGDFTARINGWATQGTIGLTPAYTIMLLGYLVMSAPLTIGMRLLARRMNRHVRVASQGAGQQ